MLEAKSLCCSALSLKTEQDYLFNFPNNFCSHVIALTEPPGKAWKVPKSATVPLADWPLCPWPSCPHKLYSLSAVRNVLLCSKYSSSPYPWTSLAMGWWVSLLGRIHGLPILPALRWWSVAFQTSGEQPETLSDTSQPSALQLPPPLQLVDLPCVPAVNIWDGRVFHSLPWYELISFPINTSFNSTPGSCYRLGEFLFLFLQWSSLSHPPRNERWQSQLLLK